VKPLFASVSFTSRVDCLDESLLDAIAGGCGSSVDRRSLLAVHAAVATRGEFSYLEVGSYHGASLQSFIADPRCRGIVSVDRRDATSPDERPEGVARYPDNTTARMLQCLRGVPGADLRKLTTIEAPTGDVDPAEVSADLCLIDGQHTNAAALEDARFCREAIGDHGVILFHDRVIVDRGIRSFLTELSGYRAYPLAHDLFVVEIGVPSLLADSRVRAQVPRRAWLVVDRLRAVRLVLRLATVARAARRWFAGFALGLGAPRRRGRVAPRTPVRHKTVFEVYTFVSDDAVYEQMRRSFIKADFTADAFVRLSDAHDDPYSAITRIGRESTARYPILCHQDVFADQGYGRSDLLALLQELDARDPDWVVAGNAGVMRSGRLLRRLVDGHGGSTGERLPLPVVTLDENFLVLNPNNLPACSEALAEFHLYGADVCLHALASGGSAYVIDFPVTHWGQTRKRRDQKDEYWRLYERARERFITAWNRRFFFRYVITPSDTIFLSRSKLLGAVFGSPGVLAAIQQCRKEFRSDPLRAVDRLSSLLLLRRFGTRLLDPHLGTPSPLPRNNPAPRPLSSDCLR
jgi:hypothetical protein